MKDRLPDSRFCSRNLPRALLASLLVHVVLLALLVDVRPEPIHAPPTATLRVRLERPAAPAKPVPLAPPSASAPAAAAASPLPVGPPVPPLPTAAEFREQARRAVIDAAPSPNPLLPPPLRHPGLRDDATETRIPELSAGFQPVQRPRKICGALVEFTFGVHEISMPVAYLCDDKSEEYVNAPGAGRNIDER